ncbi:general substrate transporter [Vararia minispora EC-137]|uniref:General substrate transporter n=1 Tax=Vararia minispora EC-137 TaxID=1314806 RepID=A0ACB8Q6L3_9AGAM|nr:general substrate transporter [Vararia minispora EC-137]
MPLAPKTYTFLCGFFAALGSVTFDLGIIASVLPSTNFLETVGQPDETRKGFITAILLLGAFASNAFVGDLADFIGRRKAIIGGVIVFLLGGSIQTGAQNFGMILAGRFFAGFGIGMLAMLAPLYQAEIAHPSIRGRLTTLQQLMLGIGALIASFIGYACYTTLNGSPAQWRVPLAIQIVPAVPLGLFILVLPESPRWLAYKGRKDECLATLARLHARGDIYDPFVQAEFLDIVTAVETEKTVRKGAWKQLVTSSSQFRRVMLGITLQFSMTGVSTIQYYSPQIFASIGIDAGLTLLLQSCNSIIAICGEIACVMFIDRLGRRQPLIWANVLSGVTFVIGTAIIAIFPAGSNNRHASGAFVAMTWIFNFFFSSAIGPLSWAYPVEIFNASMRAKATAITSSAAWISNFMIAQVSPPAFANIGWRFYLVFAICGFTNALTIWAFFPETKGRKLEEMDEFFSFENMPVFVPLAKYEKIDRLARERELEAGEAMGGHARDLESSPVGEKKVDLMIEHAA